MFAALLRIFPPTLDCVFKAFGCPPSVSAAYLMIGPDRVYVKGLNRGEDPADWIIGELQQHHRDIYDQISEGQQPPNLSR